jgi:hypothetical protein
MYLSRAHRTMQSEPEPAHAAVGNVRDAPSAQRAHFARTRAWGLAGVNAARNGLLAALVLPVAGVLILASWVAVSAVAAVALPVHGALRLIGLLTRR